ncbi:MAG: response regulator transcription factor [Bacteroidetes bacterium]|nr:response regulator transcription factor [Bacteroidota bacterium]
MIKALMVDDEPAALKTLKLMIERYAPEITELQSANSVRTALPLLASYKPQLVFLDIQMPNGTGFDLLNSFNNIPFDVIFTTAHDAYAIQAIRFSALDYLLKPIDADELKNAVKRFVHKTIQKENQHALYKNLLHNIQSEKKDFRLAISTSDGVHFFNPDEIIRLEGVSNYTRFYFTNRKPLLASKTLKEYEDILQNCFFLRTHKSHLVNTTYVKSYHMENGLQMTDDSIVEISRRRKEEVMQQLRQK